MSRITKRVALALLLLCLFLGGTALYRLRTGSSHQARQAAAGQPSPAIAPVVVPSPAAAVAAAPRGDGAGPGVAPSGDSEQRGPAIREAGEESKSRRKRARALAARAAAASEAQERAAAMSTAMSLLQKKWGNVAVELRPKLGAAVQSFEILKVAVSVDGREVSAVDGKSFGQHKDAVEAWTGTIETGAHVLAVIVEYQGNGHVFSYFNGYRYTARSRTLFHVDEGARLQMLVDLQDKGGVNTPFDKRLAIAFAAEP